MEGLTISDVEQYYTKLKKINRLKKVGVDSKGNHYVFDRNSNGWKRVDKSGKMMNIGISKRIKIIELTKLNSTLFCTFDCETKDGLQGAKLFCWRLAYRVNYGRIQVLRGNEDLKPFFDHFAELYAKKQKRKGVKDGGKSHRKEKTNVYVHNLGFDIRFIVKYCIEHKIAFQPIISGSSFIACIIEDFGIRFIDSMQFLKAPQEKAEIEWEIKSEITKVQTDVLMAELFKNPKYKDGLKPFDKWTDLEKETLKLHCDNDVIALLQIMIKVRKTFAQLAGIDMLRFISLASLAMECLRTTLDESEILNPFLLYENDGKIKYRIDHVKEAFVRESYLGGRNELFIKGLFKDLDYVDRVSMYSTEMKIQYYPKGVPVWKGKFGSEMDELNDIIDGRDKRLGFIKARISKGKSTTIYPVIGKRLDDKIMFTNCVMVGIYTSVELVYAKQKGYKIEPINGLIYPEREKYFEKFVNEFYPFKAEHEGGIKHCAKIVLNAPYGKFGQAFERMTDNTKVFESDKEVDLFVDELRDQGKKIFPPKYDKDMQLWIYLESKMSVQKKKYMNVGIASFVTAYSRLALVKMFHLCEKYNMKVYYADTDSFTIKHKDYERLNRLHLVKRAKIFHSKLGGWEIEKHFEEVEFYAPKCYGAIIIDKKGKEKITLKMKGIAKSKIKEICELVEKEYKKNKKLNRMGRLKKIVSEDIFLADRYMTFKESIHRGNILGVRKDLSKHYSMINFKRNFDNMGLSKPWETNDLPQQFIDDLDKLEKEKEAIRVQKELDKVNDSFFKKKRTQAEIDEYMKEDLIEYNKRQYDLENMITFEMRRNLDNIVYAMERMFD